MNDKVVHCLVCFATSLLIGIATDLRCGACSAICLGLGKEYGDSRAIGNRWDNLDIVADLIGAGIGTALVWMGRFL